MYIPVSEARTHLGQLVTRAQDPRAVIVLTRHGRPVAALVSMPEVERIWDLGDDARTGWRHVLAGMRGWWHRRPTVPGMEPGPDGNYVTAREAAIQVRKIQMSRAEERRILKAGGIEGVEGGEVAGEQRKGWFW